MQDLMHQKIIIALEITTKTITIVETTVNNSLTRKIENAFYAFSIIFLAKRFKALALLFFSLIDVKNS